ncbi:MAG: acyltransferase [Clostridiales bacterium]|nr:acyltransferase [Clostridiales bacterium]
MHEKRIAGSVGMFDVIKGMGMAAIVFGHSFSVSPDLDAEINAGYVAGWLLSSQVANVLMPAFFIISGYGFRKRPLAACIRQQAALMLKPYLYAMAGVTALVFMTRLILFGSVRDALSATWSVTGGFLLALPQNMEIGGRTFYFCGALWFMIALFIAWMVLDLIMEKISEPYQLLAVVIVFVSGWLTGIGRITPYCVSQGMIAVLYLYIGYKCKKNKILLKRWTKKQWLCFSLSVLVGMCVTAFTGVRDSMADGIWSAGPISILLDACIAIWFLHVLLQLNRFSGRAWNGLAGIGRNSLYIFAIHSVEMHGIPWYLITEKMADAEILSYAIILVLRVLVIALGVMLVKHRVSGGKWKIRKKQTHFFH